MTTPPSRPLRPGSRPSVSPAAAPAPLSAAPAADHPGFEELRARHADLQARRGRLDLLTEQAAREQAACQRQAEAMGISSLEALQARIAELEAQDAQAIADFEASLSQEAALQQQAFQRLEEIEAEES